MRPDRSKERLALERYLLGHALPDEEADQIEEKYFVNDGYFDLLLDAENDLIDRHLRGELQGLERSQFETHFLSSARRLEKWEAQRAIADCFRSSARPASFLRGFRWLRLLRANWFRSIVVVAAAFGVCGIGWLGWSYFGLREKTAALQSRLAASKASLSTASRPALFVLEPGLVRSQQAHVLAIDSRCDWVTLRLRVDTREAPGVSTFVATLRTAEGEEIWRQGRLPLVDGMVGVDIPSSALPGGDYILSLATAIGERHIAFPSYVFRVER